jgi:hypothetical protein
MQVHNISELGFAPDARSKSGRPPKPSAAIASTSSKDLNDVAERGDQPCYRGVPPPPSIGPPPWDTPSIADRRRDAILHIVIVLRATMLGIAPLGCSARNHACMAHARARGEGESPQPPAAMRVCLPAPHGGGEREEEMGRGLVGGGI